MLIYFKVHRHKKEDAYMLENALTNTNDNSDLKEKTVQLRQTLAELQLKIRENKLPVIIIFEGWSASGKGSLISDLIKHLDPRFFKVYSTLPADSAQMRYPMMKRFWANIPEYGKMAVMDRSWYQELAVACMEEDISDKEYARRVKTVNEFERQLRNDGYLIIKFFLQISKEEQKRRFDKLRESSETKWRVTERDKKRHKLYDEYYKAFDDMLTRTDTPQAHWTVIDTTDKPLKMSDITINYVFNADNKENLEYHCDWLAVDNQYLGNTSVCEFVNDDYGNTYAKIKFNTDVELQPNKQFVIHFRLNAADWSNWDTSNDYSMGTEQLLPNDKIIVFYNEQLISGVQP